MKDYSFKSDPRIADWQRERLREFCSSLDGNVIALANGFGLQVHEEDLLPYERGFLEKAPSLGSPSGWVIRINKKDRAETKNFTVAHELGHFVLHGAHLATLDSFDGRVNRSSGGIADPFTYLEDRDQLMEAEANGFAASVLMPANLFKPANDRLGGNIPALAKLFFVTEQSVSRRLRELGLR